MDGRLALSRGQQNGRAADQTLPVTERLLSRLPRPRAAWVLVWAAIPVVAGLLPSAYLATVGAKPLPVRLLIGLVFAYAVVLAFWAVGRFTRERDLVERSVDQLAAGPEQAAGPVFRGMASIWGPLALTLVSVTVTVWRTAVLADPWTALRWLPVSLLVNLPLLTAVWVYLALLLGLTRLGRRTLSLTAFLQDLSLGLGEVGRLAFTAFWIYGAGFAPVLVANFANPVGLLLLLGLFLLGVLVFFACLQGLHRQLVAARRHYLEWAGQLYARAYEPIRSGSLGALGEQAQLLQAAEVIQRRAEALQQWRASWGPWSPSSSPASSPGSSWSAWACRGAAGTWPRSLRSRQVGQLGRLGAAAFDGGLMDAADSGGGSRPYGAGSPAGQPHELGLMLP